MSKLFIFLQKLLFLASLIFHYASSATLIKSRHLIVLCHGIMGSRRDLSYLADKLEKAGFVVLKSESNEFSNSISGIESGSNRLAAEIQSFIHDKRDLSYISFVGNSLGGLYARHVLKYLFNETDMSIAGLTPAKFMTIATPHLGVRHYNYLEYFGLNLPQIVQTLASRIFGDSGRDLFMKDAKNISEGLLYQMAISLSYIAPLRQFRSRRLYANVVQDLMVPLGTAAFIDDLAVKELRSRHDGKFGIVEILNSRNISYSSTVNSCSSSSEAAFIESMMVSLDQLNWEKVMVKFQGLYPGAHNKICALTKYSPWIDSMLGHYEGKFVMDDAVEWFKKE